MILKAHVRRWGASSEEFASGSGHAEENEAIENQIGTTAVTGFELPVLRSIRPLEPGEKFRISFVFERPFENTPGMGLFLAVRKLVACPDECSWGDLQPEKRAEWEKLAKDMGVGPR